MSNLRPFYKEVQAHYDLSNDFFRLFLDPSMTYTCAFFERPDMTLEEAQQAKIDLALGKCDLHPGQRLLEIGCGWGSTIRRAVERHGVRVIGLTLSANQHAEASWRLADLGDRAAVRLQGWEDFEEPVDRIVCIGALEHAREERYAAFFAKCFQLLPAGGRFLLHSIVWPEMSMYARREIEMTYEDVQFHKFMIREIFPGGQLRPASVIERYARGAGFDVSQVQRLGPNYARTLDFWAAALEANREQAIALTSTEVFDIYMRYLTGCARYFVSGDLDVAQFTCVKGVP